MLRNMFSSFQVARARETLMGWKHATSPKLYLEAMGKLKRGGGCWCNGLRGLTRNWNIVEISQLNHRYIAVLVAGASGVLNSSPYTGRPVVDGKIYSGAVERIKLRQPAKEPVKWAKQIAAQIHGWHFYGEPPQLLYEDTISIPFSGAVGRSIDRDRSQPRALAGLHGCIRYIIFCWRSIFGL